MMNSYFITLIEFLFLALSTNFASWNLCSRDAFCPPFCRPLGICFCFCGLQSTKGFNPRCEPQSNRVPYMDMIQVVSLRICWISIFAFAYIPKESKRENPGAQFGKAPIGGFGKCHASLEPDLTIHSSPACFPVRIILH